MKKEQQSNNTVDFSKLTSKELRALLVSIKRDQLNLRFQQAIGQNSSASRFSALRKDVARIMCILCEKIQPRMVSGEQR